ncbi:hypothetical protein [Paenibacillus xylanivorans]|nr:hypothetical protein [Paenibacillus xylanivorans]
MKNKKPAFLHAAEGPETGKDGLVRIWTSRMDTANVVQWKNA